MMLALTSSIVLKVTRMENPKESWDKLLRSSAGNVMIWLSLQRHGICSRRNANANLYGRSIGEHLTATTP
jgi:hypothetical protein